jgi:RNA polymerase sigma factor (TIGR02999 family)
VAEPDTGFFCFRPGASQVIVIACVTETKILRFLPSSSVLVHMPTGRSDVPSPPPSQPDGVEGLLSAYQAGDGDAFDELFALLYDDLRGIAHRHLLGERNQHTLNTTALVHEAYVRLARSPEGCRNRAQFFAFVSRAMRNILVDQARRRSSQKRGGDRVLVTLHPDMGATEEEKGIDLLVLSQALDQLAEHDPRLVRMVECRFFGGMTSEETADALGVSSRTVERDWIRARAYLQRLLDLESVGY